MLNEWIGLAVMLGIGFAILFSAFRARKRLAALGERPRFLSRGYIGSGMVADMIEHPWVVIAIAVPACLLFVYNGFFLAAFGLALICLSRVALNFIHPLDRATKKRFTDAMRRNDLAEISEMSQDPRFARGSRAVRLISSAIIVLGLVLIGIDLYPVLVRGY